MIVLFLLFVLLFLAGVGLGIWTLVQPPRGGRARRILDERLARGDLSVNEHAERVDALRPEPRRPARWVAVALLVAGLIGVLVAGSTASISMWDRMGGMMGDGMMGNGMMMGGRTERSAPEPVDEAPERVITGDEFSFRPAEVQLRAGRTVNLVFANRGDAFHTLTLDALDFEVRAAPGQRIAGALEVPEPGSYEFVCVVPGHADAGMIGTLVVEEP